MSTFTDILGARIKVIRRSSFVVDEAAAVTSPTVARQPGRSALLRVFADTPVAGTVLLNGTAVAFSAGDRLKKQTTVSFTALTSVLVQGLAGATIHVEAIKNTGEPVLSEYTVTSSLAVKWYAASAKRIRMVRVEQGQVPVGEFRFQAAADANVVNGDIIQPISGGISGLTLGEVVGVYQIGQFDGITHHLEADVRRI